MFFRLEGMTQKQPGSLTPGCCRGFVILNSGGQEGFAFPADLALEAADEFLALFARAVRVGMRQPDLQ
jgi:hypothetical protein